MWNDAENEVNVQGAERWISGAIGSYLLMRSLNPFRRGSLYTAMAGAELLRRGVSGRCRFYSALGINRTRARQARESTGGIKVEREITVRRNVNDVYQFWRDLENLPQVMSHLESVNVLDDQHSHWVAKGPAGVRVEWDAEIVNDNENELITWQSLEGADVVNAGSVSFQPMGDGSRTRIKVILRYDPPAGRLGAALAKLLGDDPKRQIREDLERFKNLAERAVSPSYSERQ